MNVTGPDWPSTRALRAALADVVSTREVRWGAGGKNATEQLAAFQAAGLAAPEWTFDIADAKEATRAGEKILGRRLRHTQGNDIVGAGYRPAEPASAPTSARVWITTRKGNRVQRLRTVVGMPASPERFNQEWLGRDFWVKFIPSVAEYRQHVWDGKCIRVGKKVQTNPPTRIQLVRSRNNGWHIDYAFQSDDDGFTVRLREIAKAAVAACGYPGGAVDILEGTDGTLYVLEVNSAPALADAKTLQAYVGAITKWARKKTA